MDTARTSFGLKLRSELDRQGVSVRELARRMRPDDPETARRNVARWLAPADRAVTPSRATIVEVAEVLAVDASVFADDEEESRGVGAFTLDLAAMFESTFERMLEAKLADRERVA